MNVNYTLNGKVCSQEFLNRCAIINGNLLDSMANVARFPSKKEYVQKMVSSWRRRLHMEASNSNSYFCTLTYSEDHLPKTLDYQSIKQDLQKWFKRLRRKLDYSFKDVHVKYYLVSEFGDSTGRLHFHLCLFVNHRLPLVLLRDLFDCTWRNGRTQVRNLDARKINYVTKYIHKKYYSKDFYVNLKSNGIGCSYLTVEFIIRQRKRASRYCWLNGRKFFIPRYIAKKIWNDQERFEINSSDGVKSPFEMDLDPSKYDKLPFIALGGTMDSSGITYQLVSPADTMLFNRVYKLLNE